VSHEVTCAVCGTAFEEEGAVELGALRVARKGRIFWFCSPPCEKEFQRDPEAYGG